MKEPLSRHIISTVKRGSTDDLPTLPFLETNILGRFVGLTLHKKIGKTHRTRVAFEYLGAIQKKACDKERSVFIC